MIKKLLKGAAAFVAGIGCSAALTSAALAQTDYSAIEADPALWALSDEDSTVYLFGTIHVMPEALNWRTETVMAALDESEVVYLELDTQSPEAIAEIQRAFAARGMNDAGVTLSSLIDEDARADLAIMAERAGADPALLQAQLDPVKPWLAYLNMVLVYAATEGYLPEFAGEAQLTALAKEGGKSFAFFETAEQQVSFFADLPINRQVEIFEDALEEMADEPGGLSELVQSWASGDMSLLDTVINGDLRNDVPDLFERLFVERNRNWIPQIEAALDGSDDVFIAVGAGHLPGEMGVIALLEAEGYTVTRQ